MTVQVGITGRKTLQMGVLGLISCVFSVALACGAVGGGGGMPGDPNELILEDASYVFEINYRTMLEASDLPGVLLGEDQDTRDVQDSLYEDWDGTAYSFGTDAEDVEAVVIVGIGGDTYTVVRGEFNLRDIQYELEDMAYEEDSYRNLEVWTDQFGASVAVLEGSGMYVYGEREDTVKEILKAIDRGEGFMGSDAILRRAVDTVGDGFFGYSAIGCSGRDVFLDIGQSTGLLENCESVAFVLTGGDEDESKVSVGVVFSSERRAESGMDDIEEYIEDSGFLDADVDDVGLDGEVVTLSLTMYEE